ncbi:MAG: azurin [Bdellovibrio sp.]|nr:azurin [Methylotenera sp.]
MNTKNIFAAALLTAPLLFAAQANAAAACDVNVEVTEAMAYTVKNIDVPKTCKTFTVNLKAQGTMAKTVMGHNIVITKEADKEGVVEDGGKAGAATNYVKAKDARVVAASNVIGGGESTSVKFKVKKLSAKETYVFFCSFPGHSAIMKGVVNLV